jgi:hypothetical protein
MALNDRSEEPPRKDDEGRADITLNASEISMSQINASKAVTTPANESKANAISTSQVSASTVSTTANSASKANGSFYLQVRSLARLWVKFLAGLFGAMMTTVVLGLFGLNPLPQTVPLVDLSRRYPLEAFVIGGAFIAIFIAALILSSKPDDPNNGVRTWHLSPWVFSAAISTICLSLFLALLATVLIRPSWCPSMICPSHEPITNPNGIHDANLEVYVITTQSTAFLIPGDPEQYTGSNLPESIGAVRIDEKAPPFLYRVVLGVHSLQQGQFGIVLEQVNLVIRQVPAMPRPLNVWIKGQPLTFNTNPYQVIYHGQLAGHTLPATYVPSPFGGVELAPGEADQLNLQVRSSTLADIQFQVQIIYRVTNESQRHTLMLPFNFEVVFSDASNWHMYLLQSGHFVGTP